MTVEVMNVALIAARLLQATVVPVTTARIEALGRRIRFKGQVALSNHFDSKGTHLGNIGPVKKYWVSDFVGQYALVKSKKTWQLGVIDTSFDVVVPVDFKKIMVDEEGNIHVWK